LILVRMENPLLKLAMGLAGDIGRISKEGVDKEIMHYDLHDFHFGQGSGILQITRKNQFKDAEAAFLTMIQRDNYVEYPEIYTPAFLSASTEEDFVFDAEEHLLPVYGLREIKVKPEEDFTMMYKKIVLYLTGYYVFEDCDQGTSEYVFKTAGIYRNGESYNAKYHFFDPLLNTVIGNCYCIFDNEPLNNCIRKEYFVDAPDHYIRLLWTTPKLSNPIF
jgi:hypothetical protein